MPACAGKGITFIELPLAFDALTVVVNKDNTWGRQAQGKIQTWRQVNLDWPDRPLRLQLL